MKNSSRGFIPLEGRKTDRTHELVMSLLLDIDSDLARRVSQLITEGRYTDVVNGDFEFRMTNCDDFADDYLVANLMSKFPSWDIGVDREQVALQSFRDAEERCRVSNAFLRETYAGGTNHSKTLSSVLYTAQRLIGDLLGSFSWEEAERFFGFGPGSTYSLPRTKGDAYYKFGNRKPTTTDGNFEAAACAISTSPVWLRHILCAGSPIGELIRVPGNKVTTVPKNAKTDRVIAIEPDMNMYIQKGIGGMIRQRLKRVGCNLDDQTRNQEHAKAGSIGGLATIDLRSASDSLCTELVHQLLPVAWADAIFMCRSPCGELPDGSSLEYQKVSSMGNGFTFELESLIFWALSRSVAIFYGEKDQRLCVYGDDIIVPSSIAPGLISILGLVGFQANSSKTFVSGPFRESCGKHYFQGVDVSPFYIRKDIDTPERLIWFANSLRRYASRWGSRSYCDSRFERTYRLAKSFLPSALRSPSVPLASNGKWFSDTALGGDFDEVTPRFNRRLQTYEAEHYVRVFKKRTGDGVPYLLRCLSSLERRQAPCFYGPFRGRDSVIDFCRYFDGVEKADVGRDLSGISTCSYTYRKVKSCIRQWTMTGPWL